MKANVPDIIAKINLIPCTWMLLVAMYCIGKPSFGSMPEEDHGKAIYCP